MSTVDASTSDTESGPLSHWRMMKKVLVATDGSLSATDAIGFAVEFAFHHQAELIFVHVVPNVEFVPPAALDDAVERVAPRADRARPRVASGSFRRRGRERRGGHDSPVGRFDRAARS